MSEAHVKQHTLTEGFTPTDEQMAQSQSDFGASDYASLICSLFCANNQTLGCACVRQTLSLSNIPSPIDAILFLQFVHF